MKYTPLDYAQILYQTKNIDAFLDLLKKHWVLPWLPKILERFDQLWHKREGIESVRVISARPLAEIVRKDIVRLLQKECKGRQLELEFRVDPRSIGGFRVESDELLIPASLVDKIQLLASQFNE